MSAVKSSPQQLRVDSCAFMQEALAAPAALHAAQRFGVMTRLDGGSVGAAAPAQESGLGERGRSSYRLTAEARLLAEVVALWEDLPGDIRDEYPVRAYGTRADAEARYPRVVLSMGQMLAAAAAIAREHRAPAVVATGNATNLLKDGQTITLDGNGGVVEARS